MGQRNHRKIRKYLEIKEKSTTYLNLWDAIKVLLTENLVSVNTFVKKTQMNTSTLREYKREEQLNPKQKKGNHKDYIVEINRNTEKQQQQKKSTKPKTDSLRISRKLTDIS